MSRRPSRPGRSRSSVGAGAITLAVLGGVALKAAAWMYSTPWPAALLIRAIFEKGAQNTIDEMLRHAPRASFDERHDVVYGEAGAATSYDVIRPAGASAPLPVVAWIHGGAWISGDKRDVAPYLRMLAAEGFAGVAVNYTIAPEATYPTAVRQLDAALAHLVENAEELGLDAGRIVLAGDSAGAQLASQLAALVSNPDYARMAGIEPSLSRAQLAGTILHCGIYDLDGMAKLAGIGAWGFKTALWAYTGTKYWSQQAPGALMSTRQFVTADFPPTLISGGNGDELTWIQTVPMASRLAELGVDVTPILFDPDHEPKLPHEYQFHLDFEDACATFPKTVEFLRRVTA